MHLRLFFSASDDFSHEWRRRTPQPSSSSLVLTPSCRLDADPPFPIGVPVGWVPRTHRSWRGCYRTKFTLSLITDADDGDAILL